ncbi:hypothetical protein Ddye_010126 [Dipteronia dyeriana]|uniref:Uncharacterized protein n=1 Tax=Dipteronia dyeriana TaxID=168575 RepID=A0AAD9XCR7_9ROSI|nr:hypothetical protein Ddye_010126 [Dipteronia dyeriana]
MLLNASTVIALTEEFLATAKQNAISRLDFGTSTSESPSFAPVQAEKVVEDTKKAIKRKIEQAAAIDFQSRNLLAKLSINLEDPEDVIKRFIGKSNYNILSIGLRSPARPVSSPVPSPSFVAARPVSLPISSPLTINRRRTRLFSWLIPLFSQGLFGLFWVVLGGTAFYRLHRRRRARLVSSPEDSSCAVSRELGGGHR